MGMARLDRAILIAAAPRREKGHCMRTPVLIGIGRLIHSGHLNIPAFSAKGPAPALLQAERASSIRPLLLQPGSCRRG
jgi:hypothetical protein